MKRRRLLWLGCALVLIGGTVAAWLMLVPQDGEFVIVGPKTQGVRRNWIALDQTIDPADFRDSKTVGSVLNRLSDKLAPERLGLFNFDWEALAEEAGGVINLYNAPVSYPATAQPMPVKQFLRLTMTQTDARNVAYAINSYTITVTTKGAAAQERADYLARLSIFDRLHAFYKECTGDLDPDPPLTML